MTTTDYETVLQAIRRWPTAQQLVLMQELLRALAAEAILPRPKRTLPRALGLLATGKSVPTQVEVRNWLNERRMEKYG